MDLMLFILAVILVLLLAIIAERQAEKRLEKSRRMLAVTKTTPRERGVDPWEW